MSNTEAQQLPQPPAKKGRGRPPKSKTSGDEMKKPWGFPAKEKAHTIPEEPQVERNVFDLMMESNQPYKYGVFLGLAELHQGISEGGARGKSHPS